MSSGPGNPWRLTNFYGRTDRPSSTYLEAKRGVQALFTHRSIRILVNQPSLNEEHWNQPNSSYTSFANSIKATALPAISTNVMISERTEFSWAAASLLNYYQNKSTSKNKILKRILRFLKVFRARRIRPADSDSRWRNYFQQCPGHPCGEQGDTPAPWATYSAASLALSKRPYSRIDELPPGSLKMGAWE